MSERRQIEVFSAGCTVCEETIAAIRAAACDSCEITVLDMRDPAVSGRATALGIRSMPAVLINGEPAACCTGRGVELSVLQAAGLGRPLG